MQAQGHEVRDNVMYQDNQSAMLLENNGRGSSSKRTRHINMRCFFVTDGIHKKKLRVAHCPTKEMLADCFAKPLQGALFRVLRDAVLNIKTEDGPASFQPSSQDHRSVLNKTVEGQTWAQAVAGSSPSSSAGKTVVE